MYNEFSAVVFTQMMIMALLVFIQQGESRKIIAFIFSNALLLHNAVFQLIYQSNNDILISINNTPFIYHFTAVLILLGVMAIIARMINPNRLMTDIQYISLGAIILNFLSWGMYKNDFQLTILNHTLDNSMISSLVFIILYAVAIFTLIRGEPDGRNRDDSRLYIIRPRYMASDNLHQGLEKKG